MSTPTPRTDAACGKGNFIHCVDDDFARTLERELAAAQRELAEARKWKNEDPRMLREQLRVADSAFNSLTAENESLKTDLQAAQARIAELESATRHAQEAAITAQIGVIEKNEKFLQRLRDQDARIALLEANQCEKEPVETRWMGMDNPPLELYRKARNGN